MIACRVGALALCLCGLATSARAQDTPAAPAPDLATTDGEPGERDAAEALEAEALEAEALEAEAAPRPRDPLTLRFAFVGPGVEARHRRAARLLGDAFARSLGAPARIEVAVGSYDEVTTWVGRETVDFALLPVVAYGAVRGNPRVHLVAGSEQRVPFASDARGRRHYRSVAVAPAGSELARHTTSVSFTNVADALERARWVFVHPLSASGFVVPSASAREAGIEVRVDRARFAFSHERIRELLAGRNADPRTLAFLSEEQWQRARAESPTLRRVPFAELEAVAIPSDVLVATTSFLDRAETVEGLARARVLERLRVGVARAPRTERSARVLDDLGLAAWVAPAPDDYDAFLGRFVPAAFGRDRVRPADIRYSARQLVERIEALTLAAERGGAERPPVALVLSGGGNKCAFEAGVLRELYVAGFSPDVVVGTSGGAFNAIGVVAGFAETSTIRDETVRGIEGPTRLEALWLGLRADDVVPPWCALSAAALWVTWVIFLAFTALAFRVVLLGRLSISVDGDVAALEEDEDGPPELWRRRRARCRKRALLAAGLFAASALLAALAIVFEESLPIRWGVFGVVREGVIFAAVVAVSRLLAVAEVVVEEGAVDGWRRRLGRLASHRSVRWFRAGSTLAAMVGLVIYVGSASELVPTSGVRDFLATQVADGALEEPPDASDMSRAEAVGDALGRRDAMHADLVLTVTPFGGDALQRFEVDSPLVEHEIRQHYMWFPREPARLDPLLGDPAQALLAERRLRWFQPLPYRHMVDTAAASGALFPIFGMHRMVIDGRAGDFVDGGYAHNIPVEAASLWGARVIVVIRASPPSAEASADDVLDHLALAFETLYERAQRADSPSGNGTSVFEIGPTQTYPILSFHPDDLARSVRDGRRAARAPDIVGREGFAELSSALPRIELVRRPPTN